MGENKEIPPTPEPTLESKVETTQGQVEEVKKAENTEVSLDPVATVDARPSKKAEEATKKASQAESEGIFTSCDSFEKL